MLFRLIVFIVLGVIIYRASKSWFGQGRSKQSRMSGSSADRIDDDMVQDPQCGIYFPRREGITLNVQGQQLLFCSEKCKQAYVAAHHTDN